MRLNKGSASEPHPPPLSGSAVLTARGQHLFKFDFPDLAFQTEELVSVLCLQAVTTERLDVVVLGGVAAAVPLVSCTMGLEGERTWSTRYAC